MATSYRFLEITFEEYKKISDKVRENCELIKLFTGELEEHEEGRRYFRSKEAISYVDSNGYLGGLMKFSFEGLEKSAELHQTQRRLQHGGYWLDCYDGALVENYKKQGFEVVARLPFNLDYAPKGWQNNEFLKNQPDVVFMNYKPSGALWDNQNRQAVKVNNYEQAALIAQCV